MALPKEQISRLCTINSNDEPYTFIEEDDEYQHHVIHKNNHENSDDFVAISSLLSERNHNSNQFVFRPSDFHGQQENQMHSLINFRNGYDKSNTSFGSNFLSFDRQTSSTADNNDDQYNPNSTPWEASDPNAQNSHSNETINSKYTNIYSETTNKENPEGDWFYSGATPVTQDHHLPNHRHYIVNPDSAEPARALKRPNSGDESMQIQAVKKQCSNGSKKAKPVSSSLKDPQSIAAKNRRERISERLKVLQELVPNGSKVDLVTMLEKAISYVKFLQVQVKVLATDEFWPVQGGKAPDISQVKEAIDSILSSQKDRNSSTKQ